MHRLRFFEDYKKNEHKDVKVDDILGAEKAKQIIVDALVRKRWGLATQQVHAYSCMPTAATAAVCVWHTVLCADGGTSGQHCPHYLSPTVPGGMLW